jgi:hypothetical protein
MLCDTQPIRVISVISSICCGVAMSIKIAIAHTQPAEPNNRIQWMLPWIAKPLAIIVFVIVPRSTSWPWPLK